MDIWGKNIPGRTNIFKETHALHSQGKGGQCVQEECEAGEVRGETGA